VKKSLHGTCSCFYHKINKQGLIIIGGGRGWGVDVYFKSSTPQGGGKLLEKEET